MHIAIFNDDKEVLGGKPLKDAGVKEMIRHIRYHGYTQRPSNEELRGWTKEQCRTFILDPDAYTPETNSNGHGKDLAAAFDAVLARVKPTLDPEQIRELVRAEVNDLAPRRTVIEVKTPENTRTIEDRQHYLFPLIVRLVATPGINVYLVGPAGSGKSHLVPKAAEALSKEIKVVPCNYGMMPADMFGYMDATGNFRPGLLYAPYKGGGLVLFEEFTKLDAGVAAATNSLLANELFTFPNGETVTRHEEFRAVVNDNTSGTGATQQYVASNRLDYATLDRFITVDVPYDDGLEAHIAGVAGPISPNCDISEGGVPTVDQWYKIVLRARLYCSKENWPNLVTPRATIAGCKLAAAGVGAKHLIDMLLLRGLSEDQQARLNCELSALREEVKSNEK